MSRKITISKINILIAMILLLALGVQPAAAAGERGSLEIYYHGVGPDGGQTELSGAEFWLFPAGTRERGGWKLRGGIRRTDSLSYRNERFRAAQSVEPAV